MLFLHRASYGMQAYAISRCFLHHGQFCFLLESVEGISRIWLELVAVLCCNRCGPHLSSSIAMDAALFSVFVLTICARH